MNSNFSIPECVPAEWSREGHPMLLDALIEQTHAPTGRPRFHYPPGPATITRGVVSTTHPEVSSAGIALEYVDHVNGVTSAVLRPEALFMQAGKINDGNTPWRFRLKALYSFTEVEARDVIVALLSNQPPEKLPHCAEMGIEKVWRCGCTWHWQEWETDENACVTEEAAHA